VGLGEMGRAQAAREGAAGPKGQERGVSSFFFLSSFLCPFEFLIK
jgi:hypothetical protein